MKDISGNKLFDFMKSVLLKEEQNSSEWSTPPDNVFDNAMIHLGGVNQEKKKRRRGALLLLAGFLVIGAVGVGTWAYLDGVHTKIDSLEAKVASIEQDQTTNELLIDESAENYAVANRNESTTQIKSTINSVDESRTNTESDKSTGRTESESISDVVTTSINSETQAASTNIDDNKIQYNQPNIVTQPSDESGADRYTVNTIPGSTLEYFANDLQLTTPLPTPSLNDNQGAEQSNKWSVGAKVISNLTTLSMQSIPADAPELTGYDKFYSGIGFGLNLEYRFAKSWTANLATSYSKANNQSTLQDELEYNAENESIDGAGNTIYADDCDMETPLGIYIAQIAFNADPIGAEHGDIMTNITGVEQTLNIWHTSLGARFSPQSEKKLGFYLGGGAGFSRVVRSTHTMHTDILMEDKFVLTMDSETNQLNEMASSYFSVYGEAGLQYSITPRINLNLGAGYSHSLSSLRQSDSGSPKTYLTQVNLDLGLAYKF